MRAAFATLAFTALVAANPMPQAVTSAIAPNQSPPPGCSPNYDGTFEVGPVNVSSSSKRDLEKRNTQLGITLKNGILTDPVGRTGYIAANEQFQFDDPPQAGAIWTAGFSVCQNGSLALGSDVIWWKCLSGDFYNLYFKSIGGQCIESYLLTYPINGAGGPAPVSNTPTASTTTSSSSATGSSSSASGNSSTPAASTTATNGTASASSSGSVTVTKGGTTTVVGVGHHHTTATNTKGTTHTQGGQQTTTKAAKTTSAASSSSSSASAASGAAVATLKADIFGLAAGVLAMVVL